MVGWSRPADLIRDISESIFKLLFLSSDLVSWTSGSIIYSYGFLRKDLLLKIFYAIGTIREIAGNPAYVSFARMNHLFCRLCWLTSHALRWPPLSAMLCQWCLQQMLPFWSIAGLIEVDTVSLIDVGLWAYDKVVKCWKNCCHHFQASHTKIPVSTLYC